MSNLPRILIVDDDEDDFILARELLHEAYGDDIGIDWISSWKDGLEALCAENHDVYLARISHRLNFPARFELAGQRILRGRTT